VAINLPIVTNAIDAQIIKLHQIDDPANLKLLILLKYYPLYDERKHISLGFVRRCLMQYDTIVTLYYILTCTEIDLSL